MSDKTFAQFTDKVWCFGDSAGIDFSSGGTAPITTPYRSQGGSTSICDSAGQLLFYVRSISDLNLFWYNGLVINKNYQVMLNGDSILGSGFYHEHIIIPYPGFNNLYYTLNNSLTSSLNLKYSVIDIDQNGGIGAVIQKNVSLSSVDFTDAMSVSRHGNGRDWWIVLHDWDPSIGSSNFYKFLVDPSGISGPSIQSIGTLHKNDVSNLLFTKDGSKLLATNYLGLVEVFDFDRCTGVLSNNILISTQNGSSQKQFAGSSFSPSGRFVYVSVTNNIFNGDSLRLYQFDLQAANIPASKTTIYNAIVPASGGLHALGPDGKIYMACTYETGYPYADTVRNMYNENLSVINYPDSPGVACDFQPFSFYLGGNRCYWGLPNNANYSLGPDSGSFCDTLTVGILQYYNHVKNELMVFYHPQWQTAFVNAKGLKGKNGLLILYNINGKKIKQINKKIIDGYFTYDLNMSGCSRGIYIMQLITERGTLSKKMIVD